MAPYCFLPFPSLQGPLTMAQNSTSCRAGGPVERAVLREITQTLETEPKAPGQLGPTPSLATARVSMSHLKG